MISNNRPRSNKIPSKTQLIIIEMMRICTRPNSTPEELKHLLDANHCPYQNYRVQVSGTTLLHIAAHMGNIELVKFFINLGVDVNIAKEIDGTTPLHLAAENGHVEIVKLLIDAKADCTVKFTDTDNRQFTPLALAKEQGNLPIVSLLFEYEMHAKLEIICKTGSIPELFALLQEGNLPLDYVIKNTSFLHLATEHNRYDLVFYLIKNNVNINAINKRVTALHIAAYHGHCDIVNLLLQSGANPNITFVSKINTHFIALDFARASYDKCSDPIKKNEFEKIIALLKTPVISKINTPQMNFFTDSTSKAEYELAKAFNQPTNKITLFNSFTSGIGPNSSTNEPYNNNLMDTERSEQALENAFSNPRNRVTVFNDYGFSNNNAPSDNNASSDNNAAHPAKKRRKGSN